jgi:hypothetical protein
MTARVMTVALKPDTMDAAMAEWPAHIARFKSQGLVFTAAPAPAVYTVGAAVR